MSTQRYCQAFCQVETFDLKNMHAALSQHYRCSEYRDALLIENDDSCCAVFNFGVSIFWNAADEFLSGLQRQLAEFALGQSCNMEREQYSYSTGHDTNRMARDHIELVNDDALSLLAVSYAFAQSIKLAIFETQISNTIAETSSIPRMLASKGHTTLSRTDTGKLRGRLFLAKSEIILRYDLLDKPEFFWEYPQLDGLYQMAAHYFELQQRTEVMTLKLGTISELLDILDDDQKHRHSSKLEWIIIWLIAVEIIIFLVNDFILA